MYVCDILHAEVCVKMVGGEKGWGDDRGGRGGKIAVEVRWELDVVFAPPTTNTIIIVLYFLDYY